MATEIERDQWQLESEARFIEKQFHAVLSHIAYKKRRAAQEQEAKYIIKKMPKGAKPMIHLSPWPCESHTNSCVLVFDDVSHVGQVL